MQKPVIIGITGGIGGGKSTFSSILMAEGYPVYNTDQRAYHLQNTNPIIVNGIKAVFGDDLYDNDVLNRSRLAAVVFANPDLLVQLNQLVHPVVRADFMQWVDRNSQFAYVFVESAILFESGFRSLVDRVVVVTADIDLRIHRVMLRDGISKDQVVARMKNQMDEEQKRNLADYVIVTDDGLALRDKALSFLKGLDVSSAH